jgi:DNA mismatch endonuclease, patch repair protein
MPDPFTKSERSRIMAAIRGKGTRPEMAVRRMVHRMGYRYRLHMRSLPGTPDLVFPARRKVINVSGCFWHMHGCGRCRIPRTRRAFWAAKLTRNKDRDRRTRRALRRVGWDVLVVWECRIRDAERLAARLKAFLDR